MAFNPGALEDRFYSKHQSGALSVELLGKIIAVEWKRANPDQREFLSQTELTDRILAHLSDAPDEVVNLIEVENRPDGRRIASLATLYMGTQTSSILGRLNPLHETTYYKPDLIQTYAIQDRYVAKFPKCVEWAAKVVEPGE
jgi:hypothetical protein